MKRKMCGSKPGYEKGEIVLRNDLKPTQKLCCWPTPLSNMENRCLGATTTYALRIIRHIYCALRLRLKSRPATKAASADHPVFSPSSACQHPILTLMHASCCIRKARAATVKSIFQRREDELKFVTNSWLGLVGNHCSFARLPFLALLDILRNWGQVFLLASNHLSHSVGDCVGLFIAISIIKSNLTSRLASIEQKQQLDR